MNKNRLRHSAFVCVAASLILLANASNPPNGNTGAPFDGGTCGNCHSGGSFVGSVSLSGLPATIQPNQVYNLDLTITGNAPFGGFQMVVVDGANANCGNLTASGQAGTEFFNGREYVEQRGRKAASGGSVSWSFIWQAPPAATPPSGNQVKFYMCGNMVNGTGGTGGDNDVTAVETIPFAASAPISASITNTTNVTCFGLANGTATVTATGGTGVFGYLWSNGQVNQTAVNLGPGTYTVTVTSGTAITTASATISQPPILNATATGGTLNCTNTVINISANATGGTPPYSISWSNGSTGSPISVSSPGTYTATVTDANSCTRTAIANVSANITPPVANAGPSQVLGSNGVATLNGAGSSTGPQFSYLWTASAGGNIQSGGTTLSPVVNAAGTYTLQVTNNTNGCTSTSSTTVTQSFSAPVASAGSNFTITCQTPTPYTLNGSGSSTGPEFSYQWSAQNGGSIVSGGNTLTPTISGGGTYTLIVTNVLSGQTATDIVTISQNTTPPTASAQGGSITCSSPCVTLIASSNAPGAQFAWSGGSAQVCQAGTYTVTVTNPANSCTGTATATVSGNNNPPQISVSPSVSTLTCSNSSSQLVTTSSQNGLNYAWTGPGGYSNSDQSPIVTSAGTYTVVATDPANQCSASQSVTITQDANLPSVTASGNTLFCNSAGVQLSAAGSTTSGTYTWSGPNNFFSSTQNPVVSTPGTYTVVFTNPTNGCTASATATVVSDTNAPTLNLSQANTLTCTNTSTQVCASTNVPGTQIGWTGPNGFTSTTPCFNTSTPGSYTAIAAAPNGCITQSSINLLVDQNPPELTITPVVITCSNQNPNINNAATSSTPGAIVTVTQSNGQYIATATGTNGCSTSAIIPITQNTDSPDIQVNNGQLTCVNTTVTLNATTSTPNTVLSWTSLTVTAPGVYQVTASNTVNGCTATATSVVTQDIEAPVISCSATDLSCQGGGQVFLTTSGVVTWVWSNNVNVTNQNPLQVAAAGTYSVTVTDPSNGCTNTCSAVVSASTNQLQVQVVSTPTCDGNYSVNVDVSGGTIPYNYIWTPVAPTNPVPPGNYNFTVTDAVGCSVVQNIQLPQLPPILTANVVSITFPQGNTANINLNVMGGVGPYTYLWKNENGQTVSTVEDPSGLAEGTYSVTVTDANGCTFTIIEIVVLMASTDDLFEQSLRVYPVPAIDMVQIETDCQTSIEQVFITDLAGRQIFEQVASGCQLVLSLANLPAGTYQLLVIGKEQRRAHRRLVIQR